ncbi:hypothetical protein [Rubinisphaera italica]|uniref:Uncharacterized protein n=1 Tax=Rubinisphaera italica TaxID=2527969 RepID=A0A5C5XNU7_9PLAN|nr:hypothetical protein [Rubinisphaera italica]TWT63442.1 hypothetical protein Pan54_41950 [Rubinisphaera italica]
MSVNDSQIDSSTDVESDDINKEPARTKFFERKTFKIAFVLLIYVGVYSILSANGQYYGRPSGELRLDSGWAITDLYVWFPAGIIWERRKSISGDYIIEADPFGWFFLPLIVADRKWVHPTGYYFDPEKE